MASIKKRPDGKWQARVHRGPVNKARIFRTKGAAERWARQLEHDIENGAFYDRSLAERLSVGDALRRYREEVTPGKKGARQEAVKIGCLLKDEISKVVLGKLRTADVMALRRRLERGAPWDGQPKSPSTIQKYLAIISHLFTVARRDWGMDYLDNPVKGGVIPSINNARNRRITKDEEKLLLEGASAYGDGRMCAVIVLALETAMRAGEIVSLDWQEVDLEGRVAYLPETKNSDARNVPLSTRAVEVLEGLPHREGSVFGYSDSHAITTAFTRICDKVGISNLRFHDLRHEATSRLAERLSPLELARVTGHRDLKMLLRYYHASAEDLAKKLG